MGKGKKLGIVGMLMVGILFIVGCSSPTLEGDSWEVNLEELTEGEAEEDVSSLEYVTLLMNFDEEGEVTTDLLVGDLEDATPEEQFVVGMVQGMFTSMDLRTTYEIDGDVLTLHDMDDGQDTQFTVEFEGRDTATLTPLDESIDETLQLLRFKGEE